LQRCRKLAVYCGYPEVVTDERLKELNFGRWEGQYWDEIRDPQLQEWYDHWLDRKAGGAESFLDQYNRVSDFLEELLAKNYRSVCLFAHGGTIRAALVYGGVYHFNHAFSDIVDYGSRSTMEL
jgi:alpha-ribazole phosphatase